VTDS
jgi:hypothetical protein